MRYRGAYRTANRPRHRGAFREARSDLPHGFIHTVSGPVVGMTDAAPPLIYLPGVQGDPSLLDRARGHLNAHHRLIEVTYPRPSEWSLADHARALDDLLDTLELDAAHLLAESFGSLVGLEFGLSRPERVRSLIMVGGFCRPVAEGRAMFARGALGTLPSSWLERGLQLVASLNDAGEDLEDEMGWAAIPRVASQSPRARKAAANRLAIIARTDFSRRLGEIQFPVRYIGGSADAVVPVLSEVSLLRRRLNPRSGFQSHIIPLGPHSILMSDAEQTARRVRRWVSEIDAAI